ncbi:MAG TPA: tRNA (adenosine(37)-N6)-threonylcarbamoyltransferase complex ATPase subunit type 1 TsaE [Gemmatimonadales bacterium]|nr:tRNA (adenosine(37)-N6)-threonylcarbamoyltransferase complex ATPase subunit type 1 TsaE [Gemmatimonadales bacterium]
MGGRRVDEAALERFGAELAGRLRPPPPVVVAIGGELGTGKTTLVRAIARALGVREPVTSPTFALVHRYAGTGVTIYHVDAYRLRRAADAADLGLDDMLAEPDSVVLIEWPERLGPAMPPATLRVALAYAGDPLLRTVEVE